jgi:hypothetical protein
MTASPPPIKAFDAWVIGRLLSGADVNGELETVSAPFRPLADSLAGQSADCRQTAWHWALLLRPDADALIKSVAAVDPSGPPPEADPVRRTAHLGDLAAANQTGRFTWPRWIVRGHVTLLTSDPKVGKTRLGLELAKRVYRHDPWPDGQEPTLPEGTKTLWIAGDRHQDELRDLALAYGLPPEAVLLNADPDSPYGGVLLDDPDTIAALRERVAIERPGLVYIDTTWRATHRKLCREDEVNLLMNPIVAIAQEHDVAILGMMHQSKDGETLGRRLEGLARAVIKLSKPDPEGQPARRKLWVDRANCLEPPPLGVTIHDAGCDFDSNPPEEPIPAPRGRAREKLGKAMVFLTEKLTEGDRKQCELISEWEAQGENKGTMFNAMRAMQDDGRLVIDDTAKPKICHLVKNPAQGQETNS